MSSIYNFFKIATKDRERSPEAVARYNKILENYILSSKHPNIVDLESVLGSLTDEEREELAEQIADIDQKVFGAKYPDGYFEADTEDVIDSLSLEAKPYGFYMHTKEDPKKICGYIYGSNAKNHGYNLSDIKDISKAIVSQGLLSQEQAKDIKDIENSFKSGNIFYVENLATTSECGSGLMPSGSLLIIELVKKLKNTNFKYIFADLLKDSYSLFEAVRNSKTSSILSKLGTEVIFDSKDYPIFSDPSDPHPRSQILIKIK